MEEENYVPKHYSILSDMVFYVNYFKQYEPIVLFSCVAELISGASGTFLLLCLPKAALDLVEEGVTLGQALFRLGGLVLLLMLVNGIHGVASEGQYHYYNDQRASMLGFLFLKSLRIRYKDAESGAIRRIYWKAYEALNNGDLSASSQMVQCTEALLENILCFLLYSTVIGSLSIWMLAAIFGISLLNYLIGINNIKFQEGLREEWAEAAKRWQCVRGAMENVQGAKDIRIFGMKHWLLKLRELSIDDIRTVGRKSRQKVAFCEKLEFLLSAVRDMGAYAFLIYQAVENNISAGTFVMYFAAITGFSVFVTDSMDIMLSLRKAANDVDYIRAYMELPEEDRLTGNRSVEELCGSVEITLKDVSFSYKDELYSEGQKISKTIFEHLNLTIHAGEKIALVGVNGAGKTTLVKILCGMYEPDEGEILINGINRNEFSKKEYYKIFSVVFQEPLIFPFTVGENITLQKTEKADWKRAWDAVEKAGLKKIFEQKGIGMESYMTKRIIKSGVELSGGQRQRLLLARALYKDAPVLVLDEPTAALDPIAESEIYENYNRSSQGKTAVFISHRLASTRFSDRIIMLEDGKILETGTHQELMEYDGAYAEMFRVQSSYYKEKS